MGDMKQRKTQVYLMIIFFLLLAVIYVYLVHPITKKTADLELKISNDQQLYASLQAKAAKIAQIPDQDRIQLEVVRKRVPELPYTETILRDLRRLEVVSNAQLKQYNITLGTTSAQDPNSTTSKTEGDNKTANNSVNGNIIPIKIETSFIGTYEQINSLFGELESLDRLIQVDKMTFNFKPGPLVQINNPQEPIISNLSLIAYYSPTLQALLKQPYSIDYTNPNGRTNPFN
jgi:Tfp pilus assembly protein PilO